MNQDKEIRELRVAIDEVRQQMLFLMDRLGIEHPMQEKHQLLVKDALTMSEVVRMCGVSIHRVRDDILAGELYAEKFNNAWAIDPKDIPAYKQYLKEYFAKKKGKRSDG